jgi:peptidoglycan-associated lipoprotein
MGVLKTIKMAGFATAFAVLAGCAGQVKEDVAVTDATPESASETATPTPAPTEAVSGSASSQASQGASQSAVSGAEITRESLKASALAADTLFFFEFDKSDLRQDALDDLDAHAKYLVADRGARVRLEGHADERGTRAYNLALGERRANAVARYLVIQGVNRAQIETMSYGEERPLSLARDESGWGRNRRVELIYQ